MTTVEPLTFDPDALRERYRIERDKRLRPDGNDQYVEITGPFAHYLDDPYVEPIVRDPIFDEVDVVVIGGGFGGLLAGARLKEAGVTDVHIIEKGGDFGGTWYWNRYPGAQCDIESYIYLPLLEEIGYVPKEKYTRAPEILEHSRNIAKHYGLYDGALFQTEVKQLTWDDAADRWLVSTNRGDELRARFVCMASGPLHRPKLPGVPGIETFKGHSFHTSRWDYAYTGGDAEGNLDKLGDKVVGIIGTGATAVQCIPHLGAAAKHLYVFQRTPSSIDVRGNRPTDPEWAARLEPGWQKRRMENFNNLVSGLFEPEDLVNDGWTDIIGKLLVRMRQSEGAAESPETMRRAVELADFEKMEEIRARVDTIVNDPNTAEALKPYYRQFCKRPCFHDEYLDTYNRPNVTLVDTDGKGVDRITERGVVVGDTEYELDCLIYATGFEVGTDFTRRAGCEVVGRGGVTLTEKWKDGAATLHGMHTRGFPNLFIFSHVQGGFTANYPHSLDEQSRHAAYILRHVLEHDIRTVEVSQEAEDAWVQTIIEQAQFNLDFLQSCTPGYYNNEGHPSERMIRNSFYGGGSVAFFRLLEEWRAQGTLPGLELTPQPA
jgi:cyclohexanone monooxygenase